jgi:hypothetical protein
LPEANASGPLSLRDAVYLADQAPANQQVTIVLPAGQTGNPVTYNLTRAPLDLQFLASPAGVAGALTITRSVTIASDQIGLANDSQIPIIAASDQAAVLDISGNINVTITNVEITGGRGDATGGGILVSGGANLTLNNVVLNDNVAASNANTQGGGIYADNNGGSLTITNSTFTNNGAAATTFDQTNNGASAYGGAIYMNGGTLSIDHSTFTSNFTLGGDGDQGGNAWGVALAVAAGSASILDGTSFDGNTSFGGFGGGNADSGGAGGGAVGGASGMGQGVPERRERSGRDRGLSELRRISVFTRE